MPDVQGSSTTIAHLGNIEHPLNLRPILQHCPLSYLHSNKDRGGAHMGYGLEFKVGALRRACLRAGLGEQGARAHGRPHTAGLVGWLGQ